jgi:carbon storage regulator CsrA
MLVLARKVGERIIIKDDIIIEVIEIRPLSGIIVLGIKAPQSVRILRAEILVPKNTAGKEAEIHEGDLARILEVSNVPHAESP